MKGVVFTEFLELVESRFGVTVLDRIIESSRLPSKGAYTSVGTYDHAEMLSLVGALSTETGVPVPDLVKVFGRHLLTVFVRSFPHFFAAVDSPVAFLERVDSHVHVEVLKLYPDAQLPKFEAQRVGSDGMVLDYRSLRPFADLAQGLIEGCAEHFGCDVELERSEQVDAKGPFVRFKLTFHARVENAR